MSKRLSSSRLCPQPRNEAPHRSLSVVPLEGIAVDGFFPKPERRVFRGGSSLPFRFAVVPVIDDSGVTRMHTRLVEKDVEPAPRLGGGELAILNPLDHSLEPAVWLFFVARGVPGSPRLQ